MILRLRTIWNYEAQATRRVFAMKILDFYLEGSRFIIEADISLRQKADDNMESHWPRYFFENTQVYKETDGVVSPFPITAVTWYGCQLTANHALEDVVERITRNETGELTVREVCPELQEFLDEFKKYPAINGERTIPYFILHDGDIARLAYATNRFLYAAGYAAGDGGCAGTGVGFPKYARPGPLYEP